MTPFLKKHVFSFFCFTKATAKITGSFILEVQCHVNIGHNATNLWECLLKTDKMTA